MQARSETGNQETTILEATLTALRAMGLQTELSKSELGEVQVSLQYGSKSVSGPVLVKRAVTPANLGLVVQQLTQLDSPLLVTEYVTAPVAERLHELKIEFADSLGNAYICTPPLLIWVTGRRPEQKPLEERAPRIFQPGGLKMLFALFSRPELVSASYRDIAKAADVALGTVAWVMTDLKEAGCLQELGKEGRKLLERRALFDQWLEGYAKLLRPKFLIGRYRGSAADGWQDGGLPLAAARWGGETAAARLHGELRPALTTMYVPPGEQAQRDLIKDLGLVKDAAGEVELRRIFWGFEMPRHADMVPPLLTYADLLATAEERNLVAARGIFEQHLAATVDAD